MKLTIFFIAVAFLSAHASVTAQNVTISGRDLTLKQVFAAIKKQTGYVIFNNKRDVDESKSITLSVYELPLKDLLDIIFRNQSLEYTIEDKTIVLSRKTPVSPPNTNPSQQVIADLFVFAAPVTGRVLNEDGKPLEGASVQIRGTDKGVYTDAKGAFTIDAKVGDVLIISFLGYRATEYKITDKAPSITLPRLSQQLDESMVIGYGTTSRRFNVGSVSGITAEEIERQPVTNVVMALQGQIPGLVVTNTGGAPGAMVKMQIRGQNTLANTPGIKPFDQPLFIIDGIPFAPQNNSIGDLLTWASGSSGANSSGGRLGMSPFNVINPADVESISVLRDADATSIYGSQGANGVIIITTKKGKPGKPAFNVNMSTNINTVASPLKMLNTKDYLAIRKQALANDNIVLGPSNGINHPDLYLWDSTRYTDWYDEFFNIIPVSTNVHASFSGGHQNTSFMVSGGYTKSAYNFPGNFADKRYTLHSGFTYRSPNNKLSFQLISDYSYGINNASGQPRVQTAMTTAPNFPALLDENDKLVWSYKGYVFNALLNQQYARLRQPAELETNNFNNSVRLSYQLIRDLTISTNVGFSRVSTSSYSAIPYSTLVPGSAASNVSATFGNNFSHTFNVEPQIEYKRPIGSGDLSILAGATYKKSRGETQSITGTSYVNDDLLRSISAAGSVRASNTELLYKYAAVFGRIGYTHNKKYIINLTGRRDGSSNFGPGKRFGNFGSVGAGWIFSEEPMLHNRFSFFSFGKLSANYGTNGSDGVAPYLYQNYYALDYANDPFQGIRAYMPSNLLNPDYSWGTKKSINTALDLGFFKDRLLMNVTWYRARTSNQLVAYTLPDQTGFPSVTGNFPAVVQNNGIEMSFNSTNVQTKNFRWSSNFNISTNNNKVVKFPGLETSSYASYYKLNESTSLLYGYKYKGVNPTTGVFEFYNLKGNVTSSPNYELYTKGGDVQPLFDMDPDFTGGLGNTLTYKGLSLSFFFQFVKQKGRSFIGNVYSYAHPGAAYNLPQDVLGKYWQKPGDIAVMQRLTTGSNAAANQAASFFKTSTGAYTDASYARLKTVNFSWNIPGKVLGKTGIQGIRINVATQNLLTITGYEFGDPELNNSLYTIPMQRTISAGLSVNF